MSGGMSLARFTIQGIDVQIFADKVTLGVAAAGFYLDVMSTALLTAPITRAWP